VQKRTVEADLRGWKDEWARYAESAALKNPAAAPTAEEWLALKIHAAYGVTLDPEDEHEGAQIRRAAEALASGRESVSLGYEAVEEDRNAIRVIERGFCGGAARQTSAVGELICEKMAVSRVNRELVREGKFDERAAMEILERRAPKTDGRAVLFRLFAAGAAGGDGSGLIAHGKVCCYYGPRGRDVQPARVYYCPDMRTGREPRGWERGGAGRRAAQDLK
jgi:hypothetical protein